MGTTVWNMSVALTDYIEKIMTVGFSPHIPSFSFNIFTINTEFVALAGSVAFVGTVLMTLISRKMAEGKLSFGMDLIYFLTLYTFIAPIWLTKAMFNALFSIKTTWR